MTCEYFSSYLISVFVPVFTLLMSYLNSVIFCKNNLIPTIPKRFSMYCFHALQVTINNELLPLLSN